MIRAAVVLVFVGLLAGCSSSPESVATTAPPLVPDRMGYGTPCSDLLQLPPKVQSNVLIRVAGVLDTALTESQLAAVVAGCEHDPTLTLRDVITEVSPPASSEIPNLTVNYDRFADATWDAAGGSERMSTCREFLGANASPSGKPEVALSTHVTGEQAEQWFAAQVDKVYALNAASSDPRNKDVARKMLTCLTSKHESTDSAGEYYGSMLSGIDSFGYGAQSVLTGVSLYSSEPFQAVDEFGSAYVAVGAQGPGDDLGATVTYHLYELEADPVSGDNPFLRAVVVQPADKLTLSRETYFGPNPVGD